MRMHTVEQRNAARELAAARYFGKTGLITLALIALLQFWR